MTELLHNAAAGWADYKAGGKLAVLLLASLLYLWFSRKAKEQSTLILYATAATICCILPVTAALLMLYQTKFYGYERIWSLVPMTAVTAYGLVVFLKEQWTGSNGRGRRGALPVTALVLLAVLLCGNLGGDAGERAEKNAQRKEAAAITGMLLEDDPQADICLLAPAGILEYARETDGRIRLVYGRNMWDPSLNAYAYDSYDEKALELYQWMELVEQSAYAGMPEEDREEILAGLKERIRDAVDMGVNCILFPSEVPAEITQHMEAALGTKAGTLGDFVVFKLF